jgi:hypothetical protein
VDGVQVGEEAEMEGGLNGDGDLPAAAAAMEVAGGGDCARPKGQACRCLKARRDAAGRRGKRDAVRGRRW